MSGEAFIALIGCMSGLVASFHIHTHLPPHLSHPSHLPPIPTCAPQMFGYTRGELEKQNIKVLMPQPFSGQHDQFLANHVTTGQVRGAGGSREGMEEGSEGGSP
jgi:hypothetical protein